MVERIDLENAASPEEASELEEMTADEMAVDAYYVVAGIARHKYTQGWKFLTMWDGYGLSEATWEPMSAVIQPDGSINPVFRSYLKVLPWVDVCAGGLGAGKTSGAGTRGVSLDVVIGGRTGYSNTNGGESSNN